MVPNRPHFSGERTVCPPCAGALACYARPARTCGASPQCSGVGTINGQDARWPHRSEPDWRWMAALQSVGKTVLVLAEISRRPVLNHGKDECLKQSCSVSALLALKSE